MEEGGGVRFFRGGGKGGGGERGRGAAGGVGRKVIGMGLFVSG